MNVDITIKRTLHDGYYANIYETTRMAMGYTETEFPRNNLATLLNISPGAVKELKQIHSSRVLLSSAVGLPEVGEGDGIILDERGSLAVIKTADCTPLFFWDKAGTVGGVLHIGWRGLELGIEKKALNMLTKLPIAPSLEDLHFFMGPAIETDCYEVGNDLVERFRGKLHHKSIFHPHKEKPGKFLMNIKKGILLSLQEYGVKSSQVSDCNYCTYCQADRFPSYRREPGKDGRIFSFMLLK